MPNFVRCSAPLTGIFANVLFATQGLRSQNLLRGFLIFRQAHFCVSRYAETPCEFSYDENWIYVVTFAPAVLESPRRISPLEAKEKPSEVKSEGLNAILGVVAPRILTLSIPSSRQYRYHKELGTSRSVLLDSIQATRNSLVFRCCDSNQSSLLSPCICL